MFSLVSLYLPIRQDIVRYNPGTFHIDKALQFLSVKVFIFIQIWLGIIIRMAINNTIAQYPHWTHFQFSSFIASVVVCFEMMIAALLHQYAFDYTIFVGTELTPVLEGIWDSFYWLDLYYDFIWVIRFLIIKARGGSIQSRDVSVRLLGDSSNTLASLEQDRTDESDVGIDNEIAALLDILRD